MAPCSAATASPWTPTGESARKLESKKQPVLPIEGGPKRNLSINFKRIKEIVNIIHLPEIGPISQCHVKF